jgi:hypothetical protein
MCKCPIPNGFLYIAISLLSPEIVDKKGILRTVSNTCIYCSSDKVGTVYLSVVLEHFVGPWPLFQLLDLYTVVRAHWMGDQPVARPLPAHRTIQRINAHKHLCVKWVSNPQSQRSNELKLFMP